MIDLSTYRHVHFVGIGGIGMSALARLLLANGHTVSGSDRSPGEQSTSLSRQGATVYAGHEAGQVRGADLVVITSAAGPDNPEIERARQDGIPVIKRAELLAWIANAGRGIAVAGTHGKTSTSALIAHLLVEGGLDPTVLIGGMSANLGSNARVGDDIVVVEADEYDASFLQLHPQIAIITNVEADHLDFYGTIEEIHTAFRRFATGVTGTLLYCADDSVLPGLIEGIDARTISYGIGSGIWRAAEIAERDGRTHFMAGRGGRLDQYSTILAGEHNVRNALAAIAVAHEFGLGPEQIAPALASYTGVARRFEIKGEAGGVLVLDDYAHHPTEILVNLAAIKARYRRPLRVVFQPHTYSRTRSLLADFACAFRQADVVYLLDIFAARETDTLGITGEDFANAVRHCHSNVYYTATMERTLYQLAEDSNVGDVVVTMGAGDVYQLGPRLLEEL